ncbi:MAG: biotin-dependent carboxyltransferase family protein [Sphingomonadaceae bacterium]
MSVFLEVLEPGLLTTVQDLGRVGYQRWGIPTAGAMDPFALKAANALVGNPPAAACLEITLQGPRIRFTEGCAIAVTGGDLGARLDGWELELWRRRLVSPGSVLDFTGRRSGARAYLAVSGGIGVEPWLGSRSTYLMASVGGLEGRALRAGDVLPVGPATLTLARPSIPPERRPPYGGEPTVRVVLGPHSDRFTQEGIEAFLSGSYQVTPSSNRMGYRLEGPRIAHTRGPDLISCGIPFGGIQVPGSGQPIILMADHQTAGGYTMIATVIQADIPLVAQVLPGEKLRFKAVGLEEARQSLRRLEEGLRAAVS